MKSPASRMLQPLWGLAGGWGRLQNTMTCWPCFLWAGYKGTSAVPRPQPTLPLFPLCVPEASSVCKDMAVHTLTYHPQQLG